MSAASMSRYSKRAYLGLSHKNRRKREFMLKRVKGEAIVVNMTFDLVLKCDIYKVLDYQ